MSADNYRSQLERELTKLKPEVKLCKTPKDYWGRRSVRITLGFMKEGMEAVGIKEARPRPIPAQRNRMVVTHMRLFDPELYPNRVAYYQKLFAQPAKMDYKARLARGKNGENEPLEFFVRGMEEAPYRVVFLREARKLSAWCTCPAGRDGRFCRHRYLLLMGEAVQVVPGGDNLSYLPEMVVGSNAECPLKVFRTTYKKCNGGYVGRQIYFALADALKPWWVYE